MRIRRSRSLSGETEKKKVNQERCPTKGKAEGRGGNKKEEKPVSPSPPQGTVKKQIFGNDSGVSTTDSSLLALYMQEVIGPLSSDSDDSLQDKDIQQAEDRKKEAIRVKRTKQSLEGYPAL